MAKIEKKVAAGTITATAVGVGIAVLNGVQADASLLGPLPSWLQALLIAVTPGLLTFAAGYQAPHTPAPGNEPDDSTAPGFSR